MHHSLPAEYLGMSGGGRYENLGGILMCNNGFCGGNMCWIIILLILFCGCGNNGLYSGGNNCGCGCDNGCGGCC